MLLFWAEVSSLESPQAKTVGLEVGEGCFSQSLPGGGWIRADLPKGMGSAWGFQKAWNAFCETAARELNAYHSGKKETLGVVLDWWRHLSTPLVLQT